MQHLKKQIEFRIDKELYLAEPIEENIMYWGNLKDFPQASKAKMFKAEELKNKKLFVRFIWKENQSIAKLYISWQRNVEIVYVRSCSMNPIKKSNHRVK